MQQCRDDEATNALSPACCSILGLCQWGCRLPVAHDGLGRRGGVLRGTAGRQSMLGLDGVHARAQHAATVRALLRVCQAVWRLRIHQQRMVTACAETRHVKRNAWQLLSWIRGIWLGTVMICATIGK